MTHREQYLAAVELLIGMPVLWAQKGPDAYDCSGSVTASVKKIGGPDLTHLENAQALHDHSRVLGGSVVDGVLAGDLAFYGYDDAHIVHVATLDEFGGVISADGATSHITNLRIALANPANRVRRHAKVAFRGDLPFMVVHRNVLVDAMDMVSR